MKLHKGINRDASPSELPEGHWVRARNKVMSRMLDSVNDEHGFVPYGDYPNELRPNGFIELANGETVVFSIPSEIGILKQDGTYIRKIADPLLGFDPNYPITGDYHYGFNNRLIVAYRAGNMKPKIVNLDKLPFKLNADGTLTEPDQINLLNLFPEANVPTIRLDQVNDTGGAFISGVHYIGIAYEVEKEDATNFLQVSAPITIVKDSKTIAENKYHGIEAGEATTKSVSITLEGVDTRFKYIKIALVSKINGLVSAKEIKRVLINSNTMSFQITGAETSTPILNEEILIQRIDYNRIGTVTNLEGTLYAANVQVEADLDFQPIANEIEIEWVYEDEIELNKIDGSYKDPKIIYNKRSFMPDEVMAFYAKVTLHGGADGGAYHIPGRVARALSEFPAFQETSTFAEIIASIPNTVSGMLQKTMLTEDRALQSEVKYFQTRDTSSADGKMGYWENSNEEYPDTVREDGTRIFPEGKVRHHKFPSLKNLSVKYGKHYLTGEEGSLKTKALGIRVKNLNIPAELQDKIQSVEICYAKRTMENSTVYGYSEVLGNTWQNITKFYYDPFGFNSNGIVRRDEWIRLHPFDMLVDKPALTASYLRVELPATASKASGIDPNNGGYLEERTSQNETWWYRAVRRHTTSYDYNIRNDYTTIRLVDSRYMPHNNSAESGELNNYLGEEALLVKPSVMPTILDQALVSIKAYRTDLYVSFLEQELVTAGTGEIIYGGDTFFSPYGVRATRLLNEFTGSYEYPYMELLSKYYVPTVHNAGLRNTGDEWYETFYPYEDRTWLTTYLEYLDHTDQEIHAQIIGSMNYSNYLDYTKDYTSVNDLNPAYPYTGEEEETERPFLIMRSKTTKAEDRNQAWRIFLPNDYYESVKNRGPIENLQAYGSMLIIHHRYDLLRTVEKTTIETSEGLATLGSGDLFRMKPEPIVPSKDGYAGTQNQLSCTLTKVGYLFVDAEHGKVFLLNDKLNELSSSGLYDYFRTTLPFVHNEDNPYNGTGVITTYDEENNRVLVTKKESVLQDDSRYKGKIEELDLETLEVGDIVLVDGKYKTITIITC